jgi:hypothetical protein
MATIKISDLLPTGSELFSDSESYISELGDSELDIINGGFGLLPLLFSAMVIFAPPAY